MAADEQPDELATEISGGVPHSARIWNYWMGGKDNYQVDRAAGDAGVRVYPDIVTMAVQSRQFLDIGTGLPTMQNTHEVAQQVAPESKIVYVGNDPLVLVHARALLRNTTPEGVGRVMDAVPSGSHLVLWDGNDNGQIGQYFEGLEMLDPAPGVDHPVAADHDRDRHGRAP